MCTISPSGSIPGTEVGREPVARRIFEQETVSSFPSAFTVTFPGATAVDSPAMTGTLFFLGVGFAYLSAGLWGLADGVGGCLLMAAPFLLLYALGAGGGGDVKLMGATGMWLGIGSGVLALLLVVIAGLLWSLGLAIKDGYLPALIRNVGAMLLRLVLLCGVLGFYKAARASAGTVECAECDLPNRQRHEMPYGLAIASGTCCAALGVALWRLG